MPTTPASANKDYACDGQLGSVLSLQGTFRNAANIPDFAACSSTLLFYWPAAVPDYWRTESGACNYGSITIGNPSATSPCFTPNIFDPAVSAGGFAVDYPTPNRKRLRVDWATGPLIPPSVTAGVLYPAFKLFFDVDAGIVNGCAGCSVPMCIVLQSVEVYGFQQPTEDYLIVDTDVRNWCTWQGGAVGGAGCPGSTPAQNRTWGAVKVLYH